MFIQKRTFSSFLCARINVIFFPCFLFFLLPVVVVVVAAAATANCYCLLLIQSNKIKESKEKKKKKKERKKEKRDSHRIDGGRDAFDENLPRSWLRLLDIIDHLKGRIRFFRDDSLHVFFFLFFFLF